MHEGAVGQEQQALGGVQMPMQGSGDPLPRQREPEPASRTCFSDEASGAYRLPPGGQGRGSQSGLVSLDPGRFGVSVQD